MFQFKQFAVDQTNCVMKINTDGVLLGAMASAHEPLSILDIGTGTGVIALMLAQRFTNATIDAVEIDDLASATASKNFTNSPYVDRLSIHAQSFQTFFENHPANRYDLVVSNPPFYINSLTSPTINKNVAKHADDYFFRLLVDKVSNTLTDEGSFWLILPLQTADLVKSLANEANLHLNKIIRIRSFESSNPHREVLAFGRSQVSFLEDNFVIYDEQTKYSTSYKTCLKDFFLNF